MNFQFLEEAGYLTLFLSSFLAATFLPLSSEALIVLMTKGDFDLSLIVIIASIGNTFGGMFNYWIGHLGKIEWAEKYLKISHTSMMKWQKYFDRHGSIIAFLCWLPIAGDPLALALGYFKAPMKRVLFFMFLGKFLRYVVLIFSLQQLL